MVCFNCSRFYRRKSGESANQPTGVLPQLAAVSEESSHTYAGLTRTLVDNSHLSSVTIDSVTEAAQPVVNAVYGQAASTSSCEQTVTTNSNSWASSAAATVVPNNGLLLHSFSTYLIIIII